MMLFALRVNIRIPEKNDAMNAGKALFARNT